MSATKLDLKKVVYCGWLATQPGLARPGPASVVQRLDSAIKADKSLSTHLCPEMLIPVIACTHNFNKRHSKKELLKIRLS